ncbi:efflux pump [Microthyrium microscopicum]|uniref:Efflux pump n=1 Tax=Microthyrium microscopicum TaxID=703497 RepID=A0A6A6UMN8_9PEZI|nr:efflux pump [Microthyrium microscopicum]
MGDLEDEKKLEHGQQLDDGTKRPITTPDEEEKREPIASTAVVEDAPIAPLTATQSATEPVYITGVKLWTVLAAVTLIAFLMLLDTSIIATAIPQITNDFHSLPDVGWYGSAYLLTSSALQPLTGKIYTRFSTKWAFIAFFSVFELGSVLCGAANSSKMLIVGRAVAGMGTSGVQNGAMTILSASAPMHKRPMLLGIMMAVCQLGIVCGPLVGGALTQYASWRWCFYINLPIGAVAILVLLIITIPDDKNKKAPRTPSELLKILSTLDLTGFAIFAGFAVMFLLALEWGGQLYAWNSATIIGLFCGAGITFILFAIWEYRVGDEAMIPYSMIKRRIIVCSAIYIALVFGGQFVQSYYMPIYFQAIKGASPSLSGVYVLPSILSAIIMAIPSGVLVGKFGYYLPWAMACSVLFSIGSGLLTTLTPHSKTVEWVMYQVIAGFGRGCGLQIPIVAMQNDLPPQQQALGMALIGFAQTFGGAVFLVVAQLIFSHGLKSEIPKYAPEVNPQSIIDAGATKFRQFITPSQLPAVLEGYDKAIIHVFYLGTAITALSFFVSLGMGWKKIAQKKKKPVAPEA